MVNNFYALKNGKAPLLDYDRETKTQFSREINVETLHIGNIRIATGKLAASDPYVELENSIVFDAPTGSYPVYVTTADVSPQQDGSHYREAYLTIKFTDNEIETVVPAVPLGKEPPEEGTFYGVGVDAGMVGFYDETAGQLVVESLDDLDDAFDLLEEFLNQTTKATYGVLEVNPEVNIVYSHSGWGDGFYPVVKSLDKNGELVGYHIDLGVI